MFKYAITVRSKQGKIADCGRALERVAFCPGVTEANVTSRKRDSVTVGYSGTEGADASLELSFYAGIDADGLVADGPLWDECPTSRLIGRAIALNCETTWHGHFQRRGC